MKKVILIMSLICCAVMQAEADEDLNLEETDPILWNIDHIKRTHKAYEEGGAALGDLKAAIQQANNILEEQEAEKSYWEYTQEYYPRAMYAGVFLGGMAIGYALNSK